MSIHTKDLQLTFSRCVALHVNGSLPEAKKETEGGGAGEAEGLWERKLHPLAAKSSLNIP